MFGLCKSCIYEGDSEYDQDNHGSVIYQYTDDADESKRKAEAVDGKRSYMSLVVEELPDNNDDLKDKTLYWYSKNAVDYCMANEKNFFVVYIDSKTSAYAKLAISNKNIGNILFSGNAANAVGFLLDRHEDNGNIRSADVQHYRSTLMTEIDKKQKLVHASTDPFAVLAFPEVSLVSKGGLKF